MSIPAKRVVLSLPIAALLSLVLATQVLAAHTWSARIPITTSGLGDGVVALNGTVAVTAYEEWNGSTYELKVRRSTNSGASWGAAKRLSTDAYTAGLAAVNPYVDVVWSENGRVRYARSVDGGITYATPMALSPKGGSADNVSVARGPAGVVVIGWQDDMKNFAKARVSIDGGLTFGAITTFSTSVPDMGTSVAVGSGVVYVAYKTTYSDLQVVRSTNGGVTWSSPTTVTTDGIGMTFQFYLSASGSEAFIAFVDHNTFKSGGTIRYRHTTDNGVTWGSARQLSPARWVVEYPRIEFHDGVLRAAYGRQTNSGFGVYYQQTRDGLKWSAAELLDSGSSAPYVTYAGRIIVTVQVSGADYVHIGS
jgi:hypothetical protein